MNAVLIESVLDKQPPFLSRKLDLVVVQRCTHLSISARYRADSVILHIQLDLEE